MPSFGERTPDKYPRCVKHVGREVSKAGAKPPTTVKVSTAGSIKQREVSERKAPIPSVKKVSY